jgi:hypothetical protein
MWPRHVGWTFEERFWSKTLSDPKTGCSYWQASITPQGYGICRDRNNVVRHAHTVAWELEHGPANGRDIDHLCHGRDLSCSGGKTCLHRRCVRLDHLEAVPHLTNVYRGRLIGKTHCVRGHLFTDQTTYTSPGGGRSCKVCRREGDSQPDRRRC